MNAIYTQEGLRKLGTMIREARGSLSYRAFEQKIGVSHGTIRNLEIGDANTPAVQTLAKIARYLGLKLEEVQALLSEKPVISNRAYFSAEDIKPMVRDLPITEASRLGKWIFDYLVGLDEHQNGQNGNGKG